MNKSRVCTLIPAHNEGQIIGSTLQSVRTLLPPEDIYVVDDGSTDDTADTAIHFTPNVLRISNRGKAEALNTGLDQFQLSEKYEFILFLDADTTPQSDFLDLALPNFESDHEQDIVCVVGRVKGLGTNWISLYRQWEYLVSHLIHKKAQSHISSIIVVPGCATVYRSSIFDTIRFPTGTLTEDMDFTFMIHRLKKYSMVFEDRAIVYVQDPQNLKDFIKQITRWYTGFWQVIRKHDVPWQGQAVDFEAAMLGLEGLYNSLIVFLFLISFLPLTFTGRLSLLKFPALIDLFLFFIPTLIWSSLAEKNIRYLFYIPQFYILRFLSSLIFFKGFFLGFISPVQKYIWDTRRY